MGVGLVESTTAIPDVFIAKCLIDRNHKMIPVHIANPNTLTRGVKVATCESVLKVTRIEANAAQNTSNFRRVEYATPVEKTVAKGTKHLKEDTFVKG